MTAKNKAERITEEMYRNDAFSQWLGIEVVEVGAGHSILEMDIKPVMLNGFGVAHGGITFSLADSALAFASNGQGRHAVSIETSISHTQPVVAGDHLKAVANELSLGHRIAIYEVVITNQNEEVVGLFKGTVYRKSSEWLVG